MFQQGLASLHRRFSATSLWIYSDCDCVNTPTASRWRDSLTGALFCIIHHWHARTVSGQTASLSPRRKSNPETTTMTGAALHPSPAIGDQRPSFAPNPAHTRPILLRAICAKHDRDTVWNEHAYNMHRRKWGSWSLSVLLAWLYLTYISATGCSL